MITLLAIDLEGVNYTYLTVASQCFEHQFLATLYERGQGIPSSGDKRGGERIADVTRIMTKLKGDSTVT